MTEDEAKTKWCPFVRWNPDGKAAGAVNRDHYSFRGEQRDRCIGSACMAFREFSLDEQTRGYSSKRGGYCGLAGKP